MTGIIVNFASGNVCALQPENKRFILPFKDDIITQQYHTHSLVIQISMIMYGILSRYDNSALH